MHIAIITIGMIPTFPKFGPVSVDSKSEIDEVVGKFPPYSDFNFISMYSWDVRNDMLVSRLGANLVVRFKDYTSDKAFMSLIGDSDIDQSLQTVLAYAVKNKLHHELHLIPEHVVNKIQQPEKFIITEDRDAHDYIVLAVKFNDLQGDHYASKRNGINKFHAENSQRSQLKNLTIDERVADEVIQTFHGWHKASGKEYKEVENELLAVERLVKNAHHFNLSTIGIYIDDVMVAYSIYEIQGEYAVGHFEKAIKSHAGLYDFLKHSTAAELHKRGVKYINYEQDLGIEGLRRTKLLLHPETFLKKYTVSLA